MAIKRDRNKQKTQRKTSHARVSTSNIITPQQRIVSRSSASTPSVVVRQNIDTSSNASSQMNTAARKINRKIGNKATITTQSSQNNASFSQLSNTASSDSATSTPSIAAALHRIAIKKGAIKATSSSNESIIKNRKRNRHITSEPIDAHEATLAADSLPSLVSKRTPTCDTNSLSVHFIDNDNSSSNDAHNDTAESSKMDSATTKRKTKMQHKKRNKHTLDSNGELVGGAGNMLGAAGIIFEMLMALFNTDMLGMMNGGDASSVSGIVGDELVDDT